MDEEFYYLNLNDLEVYLLSRDLSLLVWKSL
jgi:hypothetical protein